jgi:hypothetical protein
MAQPNRLCRGRPGKALKFIGRAGNGKGSMARWRRAGGPQGRAAQVSFAIEFEQIESGTGRPRSWAGGDSAAGRDLYLIH